ncbi:hypothetical protein NEPAR06_0094 [Nematocida parisii]|uniref:Uncharacterized protein n=1 Tax=Nematocida parisii (strain ERTm3) TaxID=935791 RepID=I3EE70_NEMP3|nr:uncharacterized protein NEPG_00121 [Nematocida parisii ERTm1]EIJ87517.1 hypothetical protein NEQG_02398 [Nematocida parisii ERTm3]KAI5142784.1 hypothetical protein NEPAR07_0310 [Nematocida parisii]EIJ94599.1 hypothetical protein NEPG_00121 [Nematocida parisii ERTm1]KAI5152973.1 hypothetical protein NEPAR06_0094 [Nematocida parisii]KAI5157319.1 hypothetical protein NEPAR05_1184 [Nematocida parisii]|eukprot:XP_013057955.1 hypothetical protein NEPG_00121 [Nematocida parisii ERTm1]
MDQNEEMPVAKRISILLLRLHRLALTHPWSVMPIVASLVETYSLNNSKDAKKTNNSENTYYTVPMSLSWLLKYYAKYILIVACFLLIFSGLSKIENTIFKFLFKVHNNNPNIIYNIVIAWFYIVRLLCYVIWICAWACVFFIPMIYVLEHSKYKIRNTIVYIILTAMIYMVAGLIFYGIIELPNIFECTKYYGIIKTTAQSLPIVSAVMFMCTTLYLIFQTRRSKKLAILKTIIGIHYINVIILCLIVLIYSYSTNSLIMLKSIKSIYK